MNSQRAGKPSEISRRGLLLVLSSPSGAGKTTISRELTRRDGNLILSVSATTRPPRPGEVDGTDYRFVTADEFSRMVERGEFLEHAQIFGNHYGTPRAPVEAALAAGRDVLFDIDWQGAQQIEIAQRASGDLVSVFILPPSIAELERRLHTRAQDSDEVVRRRMSAATDEMSHWPEYHYIIVNRDVEESIRDLQAILAAERLKRDRQVGLHEFVSRLRRGD